MSNAYLSNKILISLLKQYGIKKLVLSSGARNIPFVTSVETDDEFECFSIIDERNAAFFALGLSQQCGEKVAIACTSGTAASNYITGVTEAYYSHVPLIVITFDRSLYMYKQLETQKIDQISIFQSITKKSVTLPVIKDEDDLWYCQRLLNEAFISINQHGTGPVHINVPLVGDMNALYDDILKQKIGNRANKIEYIARNNEIAWKKMGELLLKKKRVLVVIGQKIPFKLEEAKIIRNFTKLMRYPVLADNLANFKCDEFILAGPIIKALNFSSIKKLLPDLVISFGDNFQERIKDLLKAHQGKFDHWAIDECGEIRDCFKSQTALFECSPFDFFQYYLNSFQDGNMNVDDIYLNNWKKVSNAITLPEMPFTNFYITREFAKVIPKNSILHLSILNATRQMQFFNLDESIKTFSNVNAFGIDGCLPTFMGQAYATDELAFIVIGDLSFFYGMNALGIKHIKNNIRVLMINNGGGAEFHIQPDANNIKTIDWHIGAAHNKIAKGWAESLGYEYFSAKDEKTFNSALSSFVMKGREHPVFLEVFTDMKQDGEFCLSVYRHSEQCIKAILNIMGD